MNFTLTDGSAAVQLYPEWDYQRNDTKIQDVHRARSGQAFRYIWGQYTKVTFTAMYLSSADMCTVNSWWGANTTVSLYDASSVFVTSGHLVGDSIPISQRVEPYIDQFQGVIDLEGS